MDKRRLMHLAEAVLLDFTSEYNITDFPRIWDVFAIIEIESSWNEKAESPFARGLMQVSQIALQEISRVYKQEMEKKFGRPLTYDDMFTPEQNLWVGIRYLRRCFRIFIDTLDPIHNAVRAYNWGIGNVQKWLRESSATQAIKSLPQETQLYVHKFDWWRQRYHEEVRKQ